MKHLGLLLIIWVLCIAQDIFSNPNKSALLGTGYHCKYQKLVPFGAGLVIWAFIDVIWWIIIWCF